MQFNSNTVFAGALVLASLGGVAACNMMQGAGKDMKAAGQAVENKAANPNTSMVTTGNLGSVMVNNAGMTLYTYDRDTPVISTCVDTCAATWPPFLAGATDTAGGDWTIINRPGGATRQWATRGKPVYTYVRDVNKGDAAGENVGGIWHVIR